MSNKVLAPEEEVMQLRAELGRAKGSRTRTLKKVARLEGLIKTLKDEKRALKDRIKELEQAEQANWKDQIEELERENAKVTKQRDSLQERMNELMRVLP